MTKNPGIKNLLTCMALLLLASCTLNSDHYSPPNEYSQNFSPLKAENLAKIQEISSRCINKGNPISLIKSSISLNSLTVISEQNREIINLDIETGEIHFETIIDIPNFRVLGIDGSGKKILGTMSSPIPITERAPTEYLPWIAIFDTRSGLITECISGSCSETSDYEYKSFDIGASIDWKGETIIVYGEYGYIVENSSVNGYSGIVLINSPDEDYWWHIGKIAIDSHNNRIAIAFQEGRVQLEKILKPDVFPLSGYDVIERGNENQLQPIKYAMFDQGGKWLAIVRGEELFIWSVSTWRNDVIYRGQIGDVSAMSFNPSGRLLFVGTDNKIKVFGTRDGSLISELKAPGITALDISDDNRLLFWGDQDGIVHIWGILNSE